MSWSYVQFKQWAVEYGVYSCRDDGGSLVCRSFNGRIREAWTLERRLEEKERLKGGRRVTVSLGGKSEDSVQQKFKRKRGLGSRDNQCGTLPECEVG